MMKFYAFLLCLILVKQACCLNCPAGSYKSWYNKKCYTCPTGSFCPGDNRRIGCKAGYYAENPGSSSCKICPAGHRCYYKNTVPVKCGKGQYQDQKGQRLCKWCKYGEYNTQTGREKCDICPIGHRCYYVRNAPVKCGKGQYQDQKGQRFCKWCKRGEYNTQTGRTKCDICPLGHRCYYKSYVPVKCGKGQYQDQKGQRFCKWCKRGEYNTQTGRTKCYICPLGHHCYYRSYVPVKCRKGKYQDQKGQRSCKWCKAGKYNLKTGSTKCESCPAGSRCPYVNKIPIPCRVGEYSFPESVKCFSCPTGSFCSGSSSSPLKPITDSVLKSRIHNAVKYAAEAYLERPDSSTSTLVDSDKKVHGFVEYKDNKIVVSFRGTVDAKDWYSNLKFLKRDYKSCTGCEVHIGFSNYYNSVRLQMLARVRALSHSHPGSKVVVTGHSLGGAQATLTAVELAKNGYDTDLITFGSPRVGNKQFSEFVDKSLKGSNLRVTYKNDIVTVIPPQSIGYRHVGQEIHYIDFNRGFELPPKTDIKYTRLSSGDHSIKNYEKLN